MQQPLEQPPRQAASLRPTARRAAAKLQSLQAARGLAALLVLLFHLNGLAREAGVPRYLGGLFARGYCGVDIFFVLSGFLIFHLHRQDLGQPSRLRAFVTKRLLRIYPAYWIVLSGVVALQAFIPSLGSATDRRPAVIFKSFLLWPQQPGVMPILNPAWTLVHEVAFYALFAACIALPRRRAAVCVAAWLVCVATESAQPGVLPGPLGPYSHPINLEFLAGVAAAWGAPRLPRRAGVACLAVGVALLAWAMSPLHDDVPIWRRAADFGAPAALALLGMAVLERDQPLAMPRPLLLLGDASFALYLLQAPALGAQARLLRAAHLPASPWILHGLALSTVAASLLFHRRVERPLMRLASRFA